MDPQEDDNFQCNPRPKFKYELIIIQLFKLQAKSFVITRNLSTMIFIFLFPSELRPMFTDQV